MLGNVTPTYRGTALRYSPRQPGWHWWVMAHGLVETSEHTLKLAHGHEGDILIGPKARTDFISDPLQPFGVLEKKKCDTAQQCSCGLGASNQQKGRVHLNTVQLHTPRVLFSQQPLNKIVSLDLHPPLQHLFSPFPSMYVWPFHVY